MSGNAHQKVTASHLRRDAYLYVRQSTVRQVFENTESTRRQYALRERAVALGWPIERVIVIDSDLGQSGASGVDREGFQKLVGEVGVGRAGIVLGLEVSRLARNSTDWHRLLEICALTDTLILDEDGIYNPSDFNDRLLLGLKGTMSEAELHVLRARLRGGILNQARRGALKMPLPVGLVYDPADHVVLDPDCQVRQSIAHLFETFARTGSASATVRHFREQGLRFPRRPRAGPYKGKLVWEPLRHWRVLRVLHNPRYAGAFVFGRTRTRKRVGGPVVIEMLPREEWTVLLHDAHAGYICWEQYETNLRRLRENAQAHGSERRKSPPRDGPALLQGLAICGLCGRRMTVRYHTRQGRLWPEYVCQSEGIETAKAKCQTIPGRNIDHAIGELLIKAVTPMTLEVALQVQAELEARAEEADVLRRQRVERVRQEADLARRRFMEADPANRLVVDVLEAEWNEKLRALHEAQEEFEKRRAQDHTELGEEQRKQILALATDFPRLWKDPRTPQRERKRMVRLLIEDVTLTKGEEITAGVRFRGGASRSLTLPLAPPAWKLRQTSAQVVAEIDALLDHHTEGEIAEILNKRGCVSGEGMPFKARMVKRLRRDYSLKRRYDRLRGAGLLTLAEIARLLRVSTATAKIWRDHGLLRAHVHNDKNECLYEHPGDDPPVKKQGRKLSERRRFPEVALNRTTEVQCEA
ncbi:MAG: recombinase family protein [Candidatus Eisenbacteria sp.]|nr:recombinase family protein [Candidatus Eisenbacteria bacterium]